MTGTVNPSPGAQALVERVDASPGEITVVAIGPLTNVAAAIRLDPSWPEELAALKITGGAFDLRNVLQELNVAHDPEATDIVFRSAAPLDIFPLDVTLQTLLRREDVDTMQHEGGPLAGFLGRTARPWVTWLARRFGRDGLPLHDPLVVASLLDPSSSGVERASA